MVRGVLCLSSSHVRPAERPLEWCVCHLQDRAGTAGPPSGLHAAAVQQLLHCEYEQLALLPYEWSQSFIRWCLKITTFLFLLEIIDLVYCQIFVQI